MDVLATAKATAATCGKWILSLLHLSFLLFSLFLFVGEVRHHGHTPEAEGDYLMSGIKTTRARGDEEVTTYKEECVERCNDRWLSYWGIVGSARYLAGGYDLQNPPNPSEFLSSRELSAISICSVFPLT